jgi:ribosomal-protein-alanine N-acetyltransferase
MISCDPEPKLLRIDSAGARDLDEVMGIMTAAFDPRFGEAWTRSQCAGILPMHGVVMKLARSADGAPLGFALFRTVADEAELLLLAVDPHHRQQGVGRNLLENFMDSARAEGASQVHLEVRENNPAIQMYSSAGFVAVGRRPQYYCGEDGGRFDALTYARSI